MTILNPNLLILIYNIRGGIMKRFYLVISILTLALLLTAGIYNKVSDPERKNYKRQATIQSSAIVKSNSYTIDKEPIIVDLSQSTGL